MTSPVMTAEEAAWVREHAWLPVMRREYAQWPFLYDRCACRRFYGNGGVCGDCQAGDHAACTHRLDRWPAEAPLCWVTDRLGRVPILDGVNSWQVWDANAAHDPRCTCYLSGHADAAPVLEQGDLFSLLAA